MRNSCPQQQNCLNLTLKSLSNLLSFYNPQHPCACGALEWSWASPGRYFCLWDEVTYHSWKQDPIFPMLRDMSSTPAVTQTICIHIQTDGGLQKGRQKKAKQSRKSGERNHPDRRSGLELSQQEWDKTRDKRETIWKRLTENTSARKKVEKKVWDRHNWMKITGIG